MIAAWEVELLVVLGPRHVDVITAGSVFIVWNSCDHFGDESVQPCTGRVSDVLADDSTRIRESLREHRGFGIEHQSRGLERAGCEDNDSCFYVLIGAVALLDVSDAGSLSALVDRHFARHGVGNERELAGFERRSNQHSRAREIGIRRAPATALAAVMAGHASVQRLREDREAPWDAGDIELLARVLDHQLVATGSRCGLKESVRIVVQSLVAAEYADEFIDLRVIRLYVIVPDRPVVAESVDGLAAKIVGAEAEGDAAPVVGTAAEHSRAPPVELGAGCGGVRLTFDIPAADAAVEFAEGFLAGPGPPTHGRVGRHEHLGVLAAVPLGAGLDQCDVGTGLGQDVGRPASARAGTYNTDIVLWPLRHFCHPFLQPENMRDSSIVWCAREDSARPVRSQRLQD